MKYGFLGCGNMGGAIAKALCDKTTDVMLTSKSNKTAANLAKVLGCSWTEDNKTVAESCDIIFLAVKPQMMADVLIPLAHILQEKKPLLVSMAAGLSLNQLNDMAGNNLAIVRIMPNTPALIGKGMTTYCKNGLVTDQQLHNLLEDLSAAGRFDAIDEKLMDAASAAAGCSPAYAYMFIEAMADGAVTCGLPRAKAIKYAAAALAGAAEMVLQTEEHPGTLKDAVCSPGGSTIAGVRALEENGFRGAVMDAIIAAWNRNQELGKQ